MTAEQRRSRISARLHEAHQPISATALAKELGVSRQIIVGDVALLVPRARPSPPPPGAM